MNPETNPLPPPVPPDRSTRRHGVGTVYVVLAAFAVLSCLLSAGFMVHSGAGFRKVFADFDIELPWLTHVMMSALFPAAVLALGLATAIKEPLVRHEGLKIGWNILVIWLAFIITIVYVTAVIVPLTTGIKHLT